MRWILLACLLSSGCASLVEKGQAYFVVWPNVTPDVVQIGQDLGEGWYECESLALPGTGMWSCNFNTVLYFVRVVPRKDVPVAPSHAPQPQLPDRQARISRKN